jgi:hypothetical protein
VRGFSRGRGYTMSGDACKVTINCKEWVQILATNKFKKELIQDLCRGVEKKSSWLKEMVSNEDDLIN